MVLTDISMPGLGGLQVLKRMTEGHPTTPVILISGQNDAQDTDALIKLGAFAYLNKPFSLDEIEYLVDRAIEFQKRFR